MKQSLKQIIYDIVRKDSCLNHEYGIWFPKQKYSYLVVSLIGTIIALIVLWIQFPQNLILFLLLGLGFWYFTVPSRLWWLLPIALLFPPLPLIKYLTIDEVIIPALFFSIIFISIIKKKELKFRDISIFIYLYFLVGLIHFLQKPSLPGRIFDPNASYGTFLNYWGFFSQFMIYVTVLYLFPEKKKLVFLIKFLFILSLIIIPVYILLILTRSEILSFIPNRGYWDLFYLRPPNVFPVRADALRLFGLLLFQIVLVFDDLNIKKINRCLILLFSAIVVGLSGARAPLMAMIFSVFLFYILTRRYKKTILFMVTVIGVISVLIIFPSIRSSFPVQFQRLLVILPGQPNGAEFGKEAAASSRWRLRLWQLGWSEIKQKPFIGYGYRVVSKREQDRSNDMYESAVKFGTLHNSYFANLVILGSLGLLLFLIVLLSHINKSFRIFKQSDDSFTKKMNLWLVIVVSSSMIRFLFEGGTKLLWLFFILGLINVSSKVSPTRIK